MIADRGHTGGCWCSPNSNVAGCLTPGRDSWRPGGNRSAQIASVNHGTGRGYRQRFGLEPQAQATQAGC
eukprot:scaffold147825_cov28-Tisochrysis_lutea.AAC.4